MEKGVKMARFVKEIISLWDTVKINPLNKQVGGKHYKNFRIQPIEFIHKNRLGFIEGCVIKYICRYRTKNGLADLRKIQHYVDLLVELEHYDERGADKLTTSREELYTAMVDELEEATKKSEGKGGEKDEATKKS
jgi:hypothetical protein